MYGWDQGGWMMGSGWMMLGWLWMAFIWLVPVLLMFALAKYLFSGRKPTASGHGETPPKALDILDEAYARGNLAREEYLQKREDLNKK